MGYGQHGLATQEDCATRAPAGCSYGHYAAGPRTRIHRSLVCGTPMASSRPCASSYSRSSGNRRNIRSIHNKPPHGSHAEGRHLGPLLSCIKPPRLCPSHHPSSRTISPYNTSHRRVLYHRTLREKLCAPPYPSSPAPLLGERVRQRTNHVREEFQGKEDRGREGICRRTLSSSVNSRAVEGNPFAISPGLGLLV